MTKKINRIAGDEECDGMAHEATMPQRNEEKKEQQKTKESNLQDEEKKGTKII